MRPDLLLRRPDIMPTCSLKTPYCSRRWGRLLSSTSCGGARSAPRCRWSSRSGSRSPPSDEGAGGCHRLAAPSWRRDSQSPPSDEGACCHLLAAPSWRSGGRSPPSDQQRLSCSSHVLERSGAGALGGGPSCPARRAVRTRKPTASSGPFADPQADQNCRANYYFVPI